MNNGRAFSMPEQGKKSELVPTGQLKNNLVEVIKGKDKAKPTALKCRQKTTEYKRESKNRAPAKRRSIFVGRGAATAQSCRMRKPTA